MALREEIQKKSKKQPDRPVIIYVIVIVSIIGAFSLKKYNSDLSMNLVAEFIGAAFTLFVIDVLLVQAKARRWKVVQKHIDYLIARNVHRLRDGVSTRAFLFQPVLKTAVFEMAINDEIRKQREKFLQELSTYTPDELSKRISPNLFAEDNYEYFNEKADEFWNIINMKYSEYLEPSLVLLLIGLHTHLKDLCSQINVYKKHHIYPDEKLYYQNAGLKGASNHIYHIIKMVIKLKAEGYSDSARTVI